MKVKSLSRVQPFATPWIVAYQASSSMGFSWQECWNGLPSLALTVHSQAYILFLYVYLKKIFFIGVWLLYSVVLVSAAKSFRSCLTLCDPTNGSPPGSPVPGILEAKTLEWAAISFSKA